MIWFVVFFAVIALSVAASIRFVPVEHRRRYAQCPKDWAYRLALGLVNSIWVVAAIQFAIAPTDPPLFLRLTGAALMIGGYALVIWAHRHNPSFVPAVLVPDYIVTTGPYAWMGHPGYTGMGLAANGACFLLGQAWAFAPVFAYICLLARRINVEERVLSTYFKR